MMNKTSQKIENITNKREKSFAKSFFNHDEWEHQPGPFEIVVDGKQTKYTPDFFDKKRNVYIEVVGSRQAFHQNKIKYESFEKIYPNFEVRLYNSHKQVQHKAGRNSFNFRSLGCTTLRIPDKEFAALKKDAKKNGVTISEWIIDAMKMQLFKQTGSARTATGLCMSRLETSKRKAEL